MEFGHSVPRSSVARHHFELAVFQDRMDRIHNREGRTSYGRSVRNVSKGSSKGRHSLGGLIAGALDITEAFVTSGLGGVGPIRILQAIASGLLTLSPNAKTCWGEGSTLWDADPACCQRHLPLTAPWPTF